MIYFQSSPSPLLTTTTIVSSSVIFFVLGFLLQGLNSLECYDCVHTESRYPPGTPTDPRCIDPVKGGAPKVTCSSPDESCMSATGSGSVGIFGEVAIWVRRCVLPESKKKEPDGCGGVWGKLFLNKTFKFDRKLSNQEVVELILKDPPDDVVIKLKRELAEGASYTSTSSNAKQLGLDYVHVGGNYCICNTKDLCNTIRHAYDPKGTVNPPTTEDKGVKEEASCAITLFSVVSQFLLDF